MPLIPLIIIKDGEYEHIFDTDTHDSLYIDKETGGIQYLSLHCSEGTKRFSDIPADYPYMELIGYVVELDLFLYLCEKFDGITPCGTIAKAIEEWVNQHERSHVISMEVIEYSNTCEELELNKDNPLSPEDFMPLFDEEREIPF